MHCPRCSGSMIRDQRTSDPSYCLACGYTHIAVVSIDENRWEVMVADSNKRKVELPGNGSRHPVDLNDWEE